MPARGARIGKVWWPEAVLEGSAVAISRSNRDYIKIPRERRFAQSAVRVCGDWFVDVAIPLETRRRICRRMPMSKVRDRHRRSDTLGRCARERPPRYRAKIDTTVDRLNQDTLPANMEN